jgi:hypothetical protein
MREQRHDGLSLFGPFGNRKYLNAAERGRFIEAARRAPRQNRAQREDALVGGLQGAK